MKERLPLKAVMCAAAVLVFGAYSRPAAGLIQTGPSPSAIDTLEEALSSDDVAVLTEALDFTLGFERRKDQLSFVSIVHLKPDCDVSREAGCTSLTDSPAALLDSLRMRGCFAARSRRDLKTRKDRETGEAGLGYSLDRPAYQDENHATVTIHGEWYQLTVALRRADGQWHAETIPEAHYF